MIPNTASIFRAELYALLLAIEVVRRSNEKNFVIFSVSMSSLQAISGFKIELDRVQRIIKDCSVLSKSGKTIVLGWSAPDNRQLLHMDIAMRHFMYQSIEILLHCGNVVIQNNSN